MHVGHPVNLRVCGGGKRRGRGSDARATFDLRTSAPTAHEAYDGEGDGERVEEDARCAGGEPRRVPQRLAREIDCLSDAVLHRPATWVKEIGYLRRWAKFTERVLREWASFFMEEGEEASNAVATVADDSQQQQQQQQGSQGVTVGEIDFATSFLATSGG